MSAVTGKRTLTDVTWTEGKAARKATVVAWLGTPGGMMILRGVDDAYHMARPLSPGAAEPPLSMRAAPSAAVEITAGPVTVESALAAAEAFFSGHDHGSVTALVGTLALGMIAQRIEQIEGAAHAER